MNTNRLTGVPGSVDRRRSLIGLLLAALSMPVSVAKAQTTQRRPDKPPQMTVDSNARPLTIAFISYANPQQVATDSAAIAEYLEPYVGLRIKAFVTTDYGSSIEAMRSEKADAAFVDPLAFMMAHEQIGTRPLLLEVYSTGKPAYYSCIWVRRDSGIKTPQDLRGKTIAFADQVDMSGHLLPRDIFVQQGLLPGSRLQGDFFKNVYFAGGDEQAVRAVMNEVVDAAGVSQFSYLLLRPDERDQITVIARSVDSPSHLLMVRKGLPEKVSARIKQALQALDPQVPADRELLQKLYGVQGFTEAKLSDFTRVAEIAARYGFIKNPELFAAEPSP